MKQILFTLTLLGSLLLTAQETGKKTLNVLSIGNSFSASIARYIHPVVNSAGYNIYYSGIVIGGCPLKKHWDNIEKELKNPNEKTFGSWGYLDRLKEKKWDVVSIQQASHDSWNYKTYQPYAKNICEVIRKYAPTAEIVIQQTWSYRPEDGRLKKWNITQEEMTKRIFDSYSNLSKDLNLRIIPVGKAVAAYRKNQNVLYPKITKPVIPDLGNDVVGSAWVNIDTFHLNDRGAYLQACVWTGALFGCNPEKITFVPKGFKAEDAKILRETARDVLAGK